MPAPLTPTPSPRPGYPPQPASQLPEGILYVQKTERTSAPLFGISDDGELVQSLTASWALPDPTGTRALAASQLGGVTIGIGILEGAAYSELAHGPSANATPTAIWSQDGRYLAYALPEEPPSTKLEVWSLDTETGERRRLAEAGDYWFYGWTAGNQVLVGSPNGLELLGDRHRPISLPGSGSLVDASLAPDGRSLAVKLDDYRQDEATGLTYIFGKGIWVVQLDNSGAARKAVDLRDAS